MDFKNLILKLGPAGKEIENTKIPFNKIREILVSTGRKTRIFTAEDIFVTEKGIADKETMQSIFAALCEHSVHTYKNEIQKGYITIPGGIRIGICGTAVYENDKIAGIKDISALNIRIPHEIFGASEKIIPYCNKHGILIIGPPCSGKTTILRDIARNISKKQKTVIVDERSEIAGTFHSNPCFDVGCSCVLNAFDKKDGMSIAVRVLAPEVIICDEFGGKDDLEDAMFAMKSGVNVIASMHSLDVNDFLNKPCSKELIQSGVFEYFVFLKKNCGTDKILCRKDFLC